MKTRVQIIQELEILDRGWENELPQYMENGTLPDVDKVGYKFGINIAVIFLISYIIGMIYLAVDDGSFSFLIFSFFGLTGLISTGIKHNEFIARKQNYEKASDAYSSKRNRLLKQLEKSST